MAGLAQLEHHIVGHVDHVVNRPHAHRDQPVGQPLRGVTNDDPVQDPHREPATQVGVDDLHRHPAGGILPGLHRCRVGKGERHSLSGGQVPGHPGHRHGVGPVGVDLQVVDNISPDPQRLGQGDTRLVPGTQNEDAVVVVTQVDLGA